MHAGDKRAIDIWNTIGVYVGYAVAHYADFYDVGQVLILGRVTSGDGGDIIIAEGPGSARHGVPGVWRRG